MSTLQQIKSLETAVDRLQQEAVALRERIGASWEAMAKVTVTPSEWDQNGFENTSDSTLAWTDSTPDRTLSIQPTGTSFVYFVAGVRYESTGDTVQITDAAGIHVIYYDGDTLTALAGPTAAQVDSIIRTKAIVSIICWNTSESTAIYVGEERHGKLMSPSTHAYLHFTEGLRWLDGLGLNTLDVDESGNSNAHAQFGVSLGSVTDEDLYLAILAVGSTTGLPICYMLGSGPEWQKYTEAGFSVRTLDGTGSTRLAWNEYTGGAWQLTEVTNGDFVLCHIFATTEKDFPMMAIMGQGEYNNKISAREGATTEMHELVLNDILFPEIKPVATVIFQTSSAYGNDVQARVVSTDDGDDYVDWRSETVSRVSMSTSDHNALSNVTSDQHHAQAHDLDGADHTASGLTTGYVLRATGATSFAWAQLQHGDLDGVGADDHHTAFTAADHLAIGDSSPHHAAATPGEGIAVSGQQISVDLVSAWSGLEFSSGDLRVALGAAFAWTETHSHSAANEVQFRDTALAIWSSADGQLDLKADGSVVVTAPTVSLSADLVVDTNTLFVDASEDSVYINASSPPTYRGASTVHTANATQRGQVIRGYTAQSANLWEIRDISGDLKLRVTGDGDMESGSFVSGNVGWAIDAAGNAEFWNATIRGELHASVFVMDEFHASGGTRVLGQGALAVGEAKVGTDNVTAASVGTNFVLVMDDPPSGAAQVFATGDALRTKFFDGSSVYDVWAEVVSYSSNGDGTADYTVTLRSGSTGITIPAGTAVIDWGADGDGLIFETVDQSYSPYLDMRSVNASPWSTADTTHVRLGNLDGVLGLSAQYGLAAGADLSDDTEPHVIISDQQVGLFGVAQTWWDSGGTARGGVDPTAGSTDELFWLGPSASDMRCIVYGDGTMWLSTLAISGDMGAMFFSQADGLALWGPGCEIAPTAWTSTRGQEGTISGAFHQEHGRWPGTRGLVVEVGTTNLCTNPSVETNTTGWGFRSSATISRDQTHIRFGSYSLKIIAPTDYDGCTYFSNISVDASSTYVLSIWLYTTETTSMLMRATLNDSGSHSSYFASSGEGWERVTITIATSAGDTNTTEFFIVTGSGASTTFWIDAVQFEKASVETTYCDGSLGVGYSWIGTAHASASTRTVTEINMDDQVALLDGNGTFAVSLWWQAPYDYDATWPGGSDNYLFYVYEDASNLFYIRYDGGVANSIEARYSATTSETVHYQLEFSAGDWIHICVNVDAAGDLELSVDGVVRDTDDMSALTSISPTQMNLGSAYTGTLQAGGVYAELPIFDRVLTAEEIAAIYYRDAPLVDGGALNTPGVYIMDGRFSLSSSTTDEHTEITAAGMGVYDGTGPTGVSRILGGFVDLTAKALDITSDDLGWFGYDASDTLQVAWWGSGTSAGKILAGGGNVIFDENGITLYNDNEAYSADGALKWYDDTDFIGQIDGYRYNSLTENWITVRSVGEAGDSDAHLAIGAYIDGEDGAWLELVGNTTNANSYAYFEINGEDVLQIWQDYIRVDGYFVFTERSSDPAEPAEGHAVIWMSDGTNKGDDGDVLVASRVGGTTKYKILFDHSSGWAW